MLDASLVRGGVQIEEGITNVAGKARLGEDYDLARWSDGTRDSAGNLVWHDSYPDNNQWSDIRLVTLDLNPGGEPDYRNYPIDPDRPLDPWDPTSTDPYHWDIGDMADNAMDYYGLEYGG